MHKLVQILIIMTILLTSLCPKFDVAAQSSVDQVHAGAIDQDEMETFFDEYLGTQMDFNHIAGAAVAVVQDGQVLFIKGYGYADVANNVPVYPQKTVFTLGSLSKLFTWTAVMQLVERGQLDLNANVNTYLDFKIPGTYPEPITLNHLMSHTSGFEDNMFDQMAATPEQLIPLGEWLKSHVPTRVRPPGQLSAYSNYGAALAGYIVERVSGLSYDDYMEQNILVPLGMTHTTSRQPMSAALAADFSQSYVFVNGEYQPQSATNVAANVAPAGAFRSTALDMARFMIAHLNDGKYDDASILQPATAQLMHSQSFTHDPHVNGMAHGFWELDMNGQEIIGHAGSHFIFNSMLMLFPEQELGVFIVTNSQGGNNFIGGNFFPFQRAFVDHFFPQDLPALVPPPDFAQRAARFSGNYHFTMSRSDTTPQKLTAMLMTANVRADEDGLVATLTSGDEHFVEVEPLIFRRVDDDALLVFREDRSGRITHAFYGPAPLTALEKNRWFEASMFNLTLLGLCIVLFLSYLIVTLTVSFIRRKKTDASPVSVQERSAKVIANLTSVLSLVLLFGVFASVFNTLGLYTGDLPLWTSIPAVSIVIVLLTLGMIGFAVVAWKQHFWGVIGRIHYTLVTLGAVSFVWFMYFWNLLGRGF